jgi:hypothetical protein
LILKTMKTMKTMTSRREIGGDVFERFTDGRDGTLWYYRELANVFTQLGPRSLATEPDIAVRDIKAIGWRSIVRSADV